MRSSEETDWTHAPTRSWFGQVLPGSYAPNIDSGGVDAKIAGIQEIQAHDPNFDEAVFIGQVQRVFFAVVGAWTSRRAEASQAVMSPVIWQQQKKQIETFLQQRLRNVLDQLAWTSAIVAGASSDWTFDTVTVRINASSTDYVVETSRGRIVNGTRQPWGWTEDWIFQRPSSLKTVQPRDAAATCANCGAPIGEDNFAGACPYCKAAIKSSFGWMLTRIERV